MDKKTNMTALATKATPKKRGAPRGPRKASERRATLLGSAERLFMEKGYEATTMDEIAADAGYAKGTLYHYFKNKAELLVSLRDVFDTEIVRRIRIHVDERADNDWHGRIRAWINGAVEAYFDMSELHDIVIYGAGMPFRNAMADSKVTQDLAGLIAEGTQAGTWSVEDDHWIAIMMFYSFRGACDEAMIGEEPADTISERLYPLFLRMLGACE